MLNASTGGLFAALVLVAMPVAATVAASLMSSPVAAQTASSIVVEGNRRVRSPIPFRPISSQSRRAA